MQITGKNWRKPVNGINANESDGQLNIVSSLNSCFQRLRDCLSLLIYYRNATARLKCERMRKGESGTFCCSFVASITFNIQAIDMIVENICAKEFLRFD